MTKDTGQKKSQRERFIETARAFGADDDESSFKSKLAVIARQKPKAEPPDNPPDGSATP